MVILSIPIQKPASGRQCRREHVCRVSHWDLAVIAGFWVWQPPRPVLQIQRTPPASVVHITLQPQIIHRSEPAQIRDACFRRVHCPVSRLFHPVRPEPLSTVRSAPQFLTRSSVKQRRLLLIHVLRVVATILVDVYHPVQTQVAEQITYGTQIPAPASVMAASLVRLEVFQYV
jgi:hypothetical protein